MVARKQPAPLKLVLTRIFAAPRSLVFAAWTQPRHIKQWSAPAGFTIPVSRGDLRVGGKWRACMLTPQGEKLWLGGVYREIIQDRKLVFTQVWEGENNETLVTVRFADHPRGTKISFVQSGFVSVESCKGHQGGWIECFVKLKEHLAEPSASRRQPRGSAKK